MNPKVSIIVPIHNVEKYLEKCLDSIINQSLREIEIICVVNGSTDSSESIADRFAGLDSRIQVLKLEKGDLGSARNCGIRASTGEYLLAVDSDDWLEPEACEVLYQHARDHNLDFIQGLFEQVPFRGYSPYHCRKSLYNKKIDGLTYWRLNKMISPQMWDKMWNRQFFVENNLFNPEDYYYEDTLTSFNGFLSAKSFMMIDYKFYNYRYVVNSIVHSKHTEKHVKSYLYHILTIEKFIENNNLWSETAVIYEYILRLFVYYNSFDNQYYDCLISKLSKISRNVIAKQKIRIRFACKFPKTTKFFFPLWRLKRYPKIVLHNFNKKMRSIWCRKSALSFPYTIQQDISQTV